MLNSCTNSKINLFRKQSLVENASFNRSNDALMQDGGDELCVLPVVADDEKNRLDDLTQELARNWNWAPRPSSFRSESVDYQIGAAMFDSTSLQIQKQECLLQMFSMLKQYEQLLQLERQVKEKKDLERILDDEVHRIVQKGRLKEAVQNDVKNSLWIVLKRLLAPFPSVSDWIDIALKPGDEECLSGHHYSSHHNGVIQPRGIGSSRIIGQEESQLSQLEKTIRMIKDQLLNISTEQGMIHLNTEIEELYLGMEEKKKTLHPTAIASPFKTRLRSCDSLSSIREEEQAFEAPNALAPPPPPPPPLPPQKPQATADVFTLPFQDIEFSNNSCGDQGSSSIPLANYPKDLAPLSSSLSSMIKNSKVVLQKTNIPRSPGGTPLRMKATVQLEESEPAVTVKRRNTISSTGPLNNADNKKQNEDMNQMFMRELLKKFSHLQTVLDDDEEDILEEPEVSESEPNTPTPRNPIKIISSNNDIKGEKIFSTPVDTNLITPKAQARQFQNKTTQPQHFPSLPEKEKSAANNKSTAAAANLLFSLKI